MIVSTITVAGLIRDVIRMSRTSCITSITAHPYEEVRPYFNLQWKEDHTGESETYICTAGPLMLLIGRFPDTPFYTLVISLVNGGGVISCIEGGYDIEEEQDNAATWLMESFLLPLTEAVS